MAEPWSQQKFSMVQRRQQIPRYQGIQVVNQLKKKKVKRGRGKNKKKANSDSKRNFDQWSIYYVNIRNLDATHDSLDSILKLYKYNLVLLGETHFCSERKVEIPGYLTFSRNRVDKASGGVTTAVLNDDAPNVIRVEVGEADNEFIVTRDDQFETPINVINFYGQQECRLSRDEVDKHWDEIETIINKIEAREEMVVLIGDANRHLGNVIPGNNNKT